MTPATETSEQTRSKRVEMIVRQLEGLPTLPTVAARLLKATTAKDSSFKDIVSLIESDQSLTAKVLALTRRAHLGLGKSVTTVEKAVVMMGLEAVRNAVLSIQVFEAFGPKDGVAPEDQFDRLEFWKHSLAVACAAQLIVEHQLGTKLEPDDAFVCGLLHDIGKVVFDACLPKSFVRVVKIAESNRASIADVERRILGLDHASIGKKLAQQWQLPETITYAIWLHHHKSSMLPEHIKHRELIDVIYLADLMAREQRIGFSGNFVFVERSAPLAKQLRLSPESYDRILLELRKRMSDRASLIGLDQLTPEELYHQTLQRANTELGRLNQSLMVINRKLKARTRYFDAINEVNRRLRPDMPIADMLEQVGQCLQKALGVPNLVVYRLNRESGYLEAAQGAAETADIQLFELGGDLPPLPDLPEDALLTDPPAYLGPVIGHYARKLGAGEVKLIHLITADREIGGVILPCDASIKERILREAQEVEALMTACSLVLGQSVVSEAKEKLSEDLLAMGRQAQELEEKLLESRCFSAIGELAAGAAHELNNPLAIISGRAQLLRDQETSPEKRKPLEIIFEQAHRASDIVSDLMEFAKPVSPKREVADLRSTFDKIAREAAEKHGLNSGQLKVDMQEEAKTAYVDVGQLEMMLSELVTNAVDAATRKSDVRITIKTVAEDDGRHIQVRLSDNGPGMEPEVLNKATNLFFSAHPAGRKRGLGLSRVYRYAQANHGTLWLESQPGEGTTAFIRLPSGSATG